MTLRTARLARIAAKQERANGANVVALRKCAKLKATVGENNDFKAVAPERYRKHESRWRTHYAFARSEIWKKTCFRISHRGVLDGASRVFGTARNVWPTQWRRHVHQETSALISRMRSCRTKSGTSRPSRTLGNWSIRSASSGHTRRSYRARSVTTCTHAVPAAQRIARCGLGRIRSRRRSLDGSRRAHEMAQGLRKPSVFGISVGNASDPLQIFCGAVERRWSGNDAIRQSHDLTLLPPSRIIAPRAGLRPRPLVPWTEPANDCRAIFFIACVSDQGSSVRGRYARFSAWKMETSTAPASTSGSEPLGASPATFCLMRLHYLYYQVA